MRQLIAFLSFILLTFSAFAGVKVDKEIFYAENGGQKLYLDIYRSDTAQTEGRCLIFVFGGGFIHGSKSDSLNMAFCTKMAERGMIVAAIDYRLGMKGVSKVGKLNTKPIDNAIHIAAEDLCAATRFLIDNKGKYGIDDKKIFTCGSSAGAITVLQTDYERANRTELAAAYLPEGFSYAGVISFAGAVFSHEGNPDYKTAPAPTFFFHGTDDKLVVYNKIKFFNLGLFGTNALAKRFKKFGYTYRVYRFTGYGHEIASSPMVRDVDEIAAFIKNPGVIKSIDCIINDTRIPRSKIGSAKPDDLYKK